MGGESENAGQKEFTPQQVFTAFHFTQRKYYFKKNKLWNLEFNTEFCFLGTFQKKQTITCSWVFVSWIAALMG